MDKILVVEDDADLNALICSVLKKNGFEPHACFNGEQALEALADEAFDAILSDVMMPEVDGFALAASVRERDARIPILFMTALDDKPSRQYGYHLGVDDYIVKPFDADILLMRLGALLRRANVEKTQELTVGNLTMSREEHLAYVDGEALALTVREFDILFKLLSFPKKTFTRAKLMEEFWDYDASSTSRSVDVYMARLREKTSSCTGFEIVTVHGLGYKAVLK